MKHSYLLAIFVLPPCIFLTAANVRAGSQRVVTAAGVRVRTEPKRKAKPVGKLRLGSVVEELEKTPAMETIGKNTDYWYRVKDKDGTEGWIFGNLTAVFEPEKKGEAYIELARIRLKKEKQSVSELIELARFLDRAKGEVTQGEQGAELGFLWLRSLQRVAPRCSEAMYSGKDPCSQAFLKEMDKRNIVYYVDFEESGYFVNTCYLWELMEKHAQLPIADDIAWAAVENPKVGECEGDISCYLLIIAANEFRYLKSFPKGKRAAQAFKVVAGFFADLKRNETKEYYRTKQDRKSLFKTIAEIRKVTERGDYHGEKKLLADLEKVEKWFK